MDLKHTMSPDAGGSPDTDGETPLPSQFFKPFSSFPRVKKHHHQQPSTAVTYKECLKNHAAAIGSHALDGCGEFMPSPTRTPPEPASLKCAACGCHRNFHRREFHRPSSPPQLTNYSYAPHVLLSLSTADQTHSVATPGTPAAIRIENPNGRKRFRTKFSQDQKEEMSNFAEKVGWKMQRCDDKMVMDFCNEIGIRRGIFKVWMHNNKNTIGRKDKETTSPTTTAAPVITTTSTATAGGINIYNNDRSVVSSELSREEDVNVDGRDNSNNSDQENDGGGGDGGAASCDGGVNLQASTNGSSSSC